MSKKKIYVLHERSTKSHFIALETFVKKNNTIIIYREFLISRQLLKSLFYIDFQLLKKQVKNLLFIISLFFSKNKNIVLGIAPLDYNLLILSPFLKSHNIFYFTSWCDWSGDFYPKKKFTKYLLLKRAWKKSLLTRIKGVFSVTEHAENSLKKYYEIEKPISIVNHSFLESKINHKKQDSIYPSKESKVINIIYVGRLIKKKGLGQFFTVVDSLDEKKYNFFILGDGELRKDVESFAGSHSNVYYKGFLNSKKELYNLYSKCQIQLLFSRKSKRWEELFGMVIIEAMYNNVITVSTNHLWPQSIISDKIDGFLIDDDSNIVCNTISILSNIESNLNQMRQTAYAKSLDYSREKLSLKWGEILEYYV